MKRISSVAVVDGSKCDGCKICSAICPTAAISMHDRKAVIENEKCLACSNCEQRCPEYAITMVPLEQPFVVGVDVLAADPDRVAELCFAARLHPEQVICFCTSTRAGEVAAAIFAGATSPEEVSLQTGARTGCKVLCIEPIIRLLLAAGVEPRPTDGYQWRMVTASLWSISDEVKQKHAGRGFYFEADKELLESNLAYERKNRR